MIAADDGRLGKAWDLLAEPNFRWLILLNWVLSSCWDVHTSVVPLLGYERGLSASVIGTILGMFALAASLLFAVYPLMPTASLLGTCSVLLGLALGSVQPMIMSMLHQLTH